MKDCKKIRRKPPIILTTFGTTERNAHNDFHLLKRRVVANGQHLIIKHA